MREVRMRPVEVVVGLIGAAFLVTALLLRAISRMQIYAAGVQPFDPALFVVPAVIGGVAGIAALLSSALIRRRRSSPRGAGGPASSTAAKDPAARVKSPASRLDA